MGGCLLGDNLSWAGVMFAYNSMRPDPEIVGDRWRDMWFERLEHSDLWVDTWLRHQHRDSYWRYGSVCEDYSAIDVPVMAVSGWADGYSNAVFRLLANLSVPRLGLVGPWSHRYPNLGVPGPAIGFLQETVRWWDHWLKGRDTQIMDEPMLRAYMLDSIPPTTRYPQRPGRWIGEPSWPSPTVKDETWVLGQWHLVPEGTEAVVERELTVQSPLTLGMLCSYSATPDFPYDQREDDGGALVFESPPLEEPLEILGAPEVELVLASQRPVATVVVRLSDTAPDDKATRVTYGLLNLTHRQSHENPEPLSPGEEFRIRLPLNDVSYSFPVGHRLRLAVSTSYWPLAWPPPQPARLTVSTGSSRFHLPARQPRPEDDEVAFAPPEDTPSLATTVVETGEYTWLVKRDLATDTSSLVVINDDGIRHLDEIDLDVEQRVHEWYSSVADDFTSARGEVKSVRGLRRGDWNVRTVTCTTLSCDTTTLHLHAQLDAYEGDQRVYSRNFSERFVRHLL